VFSKPKTPMAVLNRKLLNPTSTRQSKRVSPRKSDREDEEMSTVRRTDEFIEAQVGEQGVVDVSKMLMKAHNR
jgi:hypothetical protein